MFSRNIKFQVDIAPVHGEPEVDGQKVHCVNFTLLTGQYWRGSSMIVGCEVTMYR